MPPPPLLAPELMAPAGNWDCARAAVENGADAIYFGLQGGFNARARAVNFTTDELPELMTYLRTRGVRGYLTLNTLVFSDELEEAEHAARIAIEAGVDAILVQDLGLLRLLHRLCPDLPLHASTQMTLSSAECLREVESLGVRRVVLPRELSIDEIAAIRQQTSIELEAFVHGALCISYSGQCQASLALGGRSANRGQCAQPCRLPYEILCDGKRLDTGENRYPFSPHDLAAYDRVAELMAAGVAALKIEGRLKPPEYVAAVTQHYRTAIDTAVAGKTVSLSTADVAELETTFSRGFCHGWLDGNDHKALVSGAGSAKRGVYLGEVVVVHGERVAVQLAGPLQRGDGIVFEADRSQANEEGGRVYEIFQGRCSVKEAAAGDHVDLAFGRGELDFTRVRKGQKVWKTNDPQLEKRLRKSFAHRTRRLALDLNVEAAVGKTLRIVAQTASGMSCHVESAEPLAEAQKHPLTVEVLTEQLARLGNSPFQLRHLQATIDGKVMVPLSVLGKLRRELVQLLEAATAKPPRRTLLEESPLPQLRAATGLCEATTRHDTSEIPANLHVLCRSLEQLRAVLDGGIQSVVADFSDVSQYREAVQLAHGRQATIQLATPRIQKPGETAVFDSLADCAPEGLLVRNLAGLAFCRRQGLTAVADFSLNAVNEVTVNWLQEQGAIRTTAAYDLDPNRLLDLAGKLPPRSLEIVVHRHTELFHSAFCLFCAALSSGSNRNNCGRPCRKHEVRLRDRYGVQHRLITDSQCRNRLFHAEAEELLKPLDALRKSGVHDLRIELLDQQSAAEVKRVIEPIQRLLASACREDA